MRARLEADLPAVTPLSGNAQNVALPDASLDAVLCAQAFHGFDTRETLDEFHRVLKPGGRLGLVWNVRDESVDWVANSPPSSRPTRAPRCVSTAANGAGRSRTQGLTR